MVSKHRAPPRIRSHGPRRMTGGKLGTPYESVAVDASAVGRQLEEPPHDPLVPLLLLPGPDRHRTRRAETALLWPKTEPESSGRSPESNARAMPRRVPRRRRAERGPGSSGADAGIERETGAVSFVAAAAARRVVVVALCCALCVPVCGPACCHCVSNSASAVLQWGQKQSQGDLYSTLVAATALIFKLAW